MNKTTETILYELKKELKHRGITYQEVANKLGYTRGAVSSMLNGHTGMTLKQLINILDLIGGSLTVNLEGGAKYKLEGFNNNIKFKKVK